MARVWKLRAKKLDSRRRQYRFTALDSIQSIKYRKRAGILCRGIAAVGRDSYRFHTELNAMGRVVLSLKLLLLKVLHLNYMLTTVDSENMWGKLNKIERKWVTIDSLVEEDIHSTFRVQSKSELHRLFNGFRFPNILRTDDRHKFTGQEVFLCGLYRLHFPNNCSMQGWKTIFGFYPQRVSDCFKLFLAFMLHNWAYLLLDNMSYWVPHMQECAEAIRRKLGALGCPFPPAGSIGGFNVFSFIDNTMNATCRPGGGPKRDGANAPRNDPLIQRAWYNGWKKLHGMKWQTIDLPNGMNFSVYGPISIRHNDLYALNLSDYNAKLVAAQQGLPFQYVTYGDSAYIVVHDSHIRARHSYAVNTPREILENRAMSSCREVIEWDYGDVGTTWAFVDYKKGLKIRKMPVGAIYLCAMLLRNALNTLHAGNVRNVN